MTLFHSIVMQHLLVAAAVDALFHNGYNNFVVGLPLDELYGVNKILLLMDSWFVLTWLFL